MILLCCARACPARVRNCLESWSTLAVEKDETPFSEFGAVAGLVAAAERTLLGSRALY